MKCPMTRINLSTILQQGSGPRTKFWTLRAEAREGVSCSEALNRPQVELILVRSLEFGSTSLTTQTHRAAIT